jgi:hypothetical protein
MAGVSTRPLAEGDFRLIWRPDDVEIFFTFHTTRRAKYLAKQTVDTFFVRMGDVVSAALVFFVAHLVGWGVRTFALCNLFLTLGWVWLAWLILRQPTTAALKAD